MTDKPPKNIAASVRQRLLNLARERKEEFQHLLTRYGNERLLARIAASAHAREFVVKGATLFTLWSGEPHRATRDLDLLGFGEPALDRLEVIFRSVCAMPVEDDGLTFDAASVSASRIRDDEEYEGVRVELLATLGGARIPMQVDVGFGDAVTPPPEETTFPTLLDLPAPTLAAYPRPTVVAEKVQAMVVLGIANSRMKDFFDVWLLSREFEFDGDELARAVAATFARRRTTLTPETPMALTQTFATDPSKVTQWGAFVNRSRPVHTPPPLPDVVGNIGEFVLPVLDACRRGARFASGWSAGGPWSPKE